MQHLQVKLEQFKDEGVQMQERIEDLKKPKKLRKYKDASNFNFLGMFDDDESEEENEDKFT